MKRKLKITQATLTELYLGRADLERRVLVKGERGLGRLYQAVAKEINARTLFIDNAVRGKACS